MSGSLPPSFSSLLPTQVKAFKTEYQQISDEHDRTQKEVEACHKEWTSYERKDIKMREDAKNAKAQLKKSEAGLKALVAQRAAAASELETHLQRLPQVAAALPALQRERAAAEQVVEALFEANKGKTAALRGELQAKEKELKKVRAALDEEQAAFDEATAGLQIFRQRAHAAQNELAKVAGDLAAVKDRIAGLQVCVCVCVCVLLALDCCCALLHWFGWRGGGRRRSTGTTFHRWHTRM
jgi:chromosome segregation ATPase